MYIFEVDLYKNLELRIVFLSNMFECDMLQLNS